MDNRKVGNRKLCVVCVAIKKNPFGEASLQEMLEWHEEVFQRTCKESADANVPVAKAYWRV